jgi:dolichol-phosphate mannosyltransferase
MTASSPDNAANAPRVLVTLCTYKERENLETLIPAIRSALPAADIVVVDDSSPDGTADFVRELSANDPAVHLLLRREKAGLGAATINGFRWGLEQGYDAIVNMDADFSHPPAVLPQLVAGLDRADVVIGSRYIPGGGIEGWPWFRHFMSQGVNVYSRLLLGLKCRDCSGAFRCYRSSLLRQVNFDHFRSQGYAFQEEILYHLKRLGARFEEVPIVFQDRVTGASKINRKEVVRALKDIFLLAIDRLRGRKIPAPK